MPLSTLVVCSDAQLLQRMIPVFEVAGIETDVCTRAADAEARLNTTKYEAVLVDCAGLAGAQEVLDQVHRAGANRSSVTFAIVSEITTPREAASLGASFVLERSFSQDWLLRSLRAAQGLMLIEQRRYYRQPVDLLVWLQKPGGEEIALTATDLSQGGMGVRTPHSLAPRGKVDLRFELPDGSAVNAEAEVAWTREGRAGLQFSRLPRPCRSKLTEWLLQERDKVEPAPPTIPASMNAPGTRVPSVGRRLLCHAFVNNLPVAWKCSDCAWRHSIRMDESRWRYANEPPESVVQAFDSHDCAQQPTP